MTTNWNKTWIFVYQVWILSSQEGQLVVAQAVVVAVAMLAEEHTILDVVVEMGEGEETTNPLVITITEVEVDQIKGYSALNVEALTMQAHVLNDDKQQLPRVFVRWWFYLEDQMPEDTDVSDTYNIQLWILDKVSRHAKSTRPHGLMEQEYMLGASLSLINLLTGT